MSVSVRVFYNARDFFGGIVWEEDAAREVPTVAEAMPLVKKCMRSMLGPCKADAARAFRIESGDARGLVLYSEAGMGVVDVSRVVGGGVVGSVLKMDRAAALAHARGVLVSLLGDDRADGLQVPAED